MLFLEVEKSFLALIHSIWRIKLFALSTTYRLVASVVIPEGVKNLALVPVPFTEPLAAYRAQEMKSIKWLDAKSGKSGTMDTYMDTNTKTEIV